MKKLSKKVILLALGLLPLGFSAIAQTPVTFPVNGVYDERPSRYAFINATVVIDYQTVIQNATLIINNGKVEEVGTNLVIPKDAQVVDLKGKFIYPSFVDAYSDYGVTKPKQEPINWSRLEYVSRKVGAYNWNAAIKPEMNGGEQFAANPKDAKELRELGFGAVLTHHADGISRGTGVVVSLADEKENKLIIKSNASAHYSFNKGTSIQGYPSSLMGSIALLRQTYLDAEWYRNGGSKKEYNISLDYWNKTQDLPQIFEVSSKLDILRADKVGDEFGKQYIIKGSGEEYQRVAEVKKTNASLIIPVNYPEAYDVADPIDALNVSLTEMKHWELAPTNAASLANANIEFAFTTQGLKNKADFFKNVLKAVEYGLDKKIALKALTFTPAKLLKVENELGSLKKGANANFIVTSKDVFEKGVIIYENWISGKKHTLKEWTVSDLRGEYKLSLNVGNSGNSQTYKLKIEGETDNLANLEAKLFEKDTVSIAATIKIEKENISFQIPSNDKVEKRQIRLSGWKTNNMALNSINLQGEGQNIDGTWVKWTAEKTKEFTAVAKKDDKTTDKVADKLELGKITYPFMAFGWTEQPKVETVLIKNATVWTNEKDGVLKETDVVLQGGKIAQIGKNLQVPNAKIIDGTGKHLTTGIIDEHSHIGMARGVNEGVNSNSSEVRVADIVNSDDISIYRHLAGGVVMVQQLHGSANAIGGQSSITKLRWGLAPEDMKVAGADGFIKFALGENVKQANWGLANPTRFPQTRMGVEQVYEDAFTRAREYEANRKKDAIGTRKDLQMETMLEILNKKRFVTCHSYVQSEINMLMKVAEKHGFRINTFTHILEGYKVADKMKAHGVNASSFADWWAYKMEVVDAIPYNAAILTKVGVITCINSDDAEMARRLNQEAAKTVKYGNLTEEEAWKTVTLNPAKTLHLDNSMGSVKVGKLADIVLWSENPLSIYAKAEKTFIDGALYFDREKDTQMQTEVRTERNRLIQKMLGAKKSGEATQKPVFKKFEMVHCEDFIDVWHKEE